LICTIGRQAAGRTGRQEDAEMIEKLKSDKVRYLIFGLLLVVALVIVIGAGENGQVGKYQVAMNAGNMAVYVTVIDTETEKLSL
jgi:hypothetical protein